MKESSGAEPVPSSGPALLEEAEFAIVGIGSSAGGLEAVTELLKGIPADAKLALISVQHLSSEHKSELADLLQRVTPLKVTWAVDGETVDVGRLYLAPPGKNLALERGKLAVRERLEPTSGTEVDFLFRSLADDVQHRAIGVVLSGNGSDGVLGSKSIKAAGGIVFAQEERTCGFPSMPRSVIDAEAVDRILPPALIADELVKLSQHSSLLWKHLRPDDTPGSPSDEENLAAVFRSLRARRGVDFSEYKPSTIKRRLVRRMILTKTSSLAEYAKLVQKSRDEVDALYESMLINVTEFFRDPECFDFLAQHILPDILEAHADGSPIRLWVPGCSTGEEAYSLAILFHELIEARQQSTPVQIFATDVSDRAIGQARAGLYTSGEVSSMDPERLRRFFHKSERGYTIHKTVRDMCVFARQNIATDSPFSRLDLISCRNLLIYLGPKLQRKLMPIMHFALVPNGYLMLGGSESAGGHGELFRMVDRRFRIYARKTTGLRPTLEFSVDQIPPSLTVLPPPLQSMPDEPTEPVDIIREADRIVLNRHSPTGVLLNDNLDVIQFRGDVSAYLSFQPGRASLNVMNMAREGLASELRAAIFEAKDSTGRSHRLAFLPTGSDDGRQVEIDVTPIDFASGKDRFYLVLFVEKSAQKNPGRPARRKKLDPAETYLAQAEKLRQDLEATRSYLQSAIEKHEATNQELRAANEEIQSSNEELQSTNEELETAKEELQSTNEELTTVNEELHNRQLELMQANNDLHNLINSVHLPIIILGRDMRIRRFTPMAEKVLRVIPTDVGRPLTDINININFPDLPRLIAQVTESFTIEEREVQDHQGRWYLIRLRPYKTEDNKIEGVVMTLIDVDDMRKTIGELEATRSIAQAVVDATPMPMAALNSDFCPKVANQAFYAFFKTSRDFSKERSLFDFVARSDDEAKLRAALERIFTTGEAIKDFKVTLNVHTIGAQAVSIDARRISSGMKAYPLLLTLFTVSTDV